MMRFPTHNTMNTSATPICPCVNRSTWDSMFNMQLHTREAAVTAGVYTPLEWTPEAALCSWAEGLCLHGDVEDKPEAARIVLGGIPCHPHFCPVVC